MQIPDWLIIANLDSILSEEEALKKLLEMIQTTNKVESVDVLKEDLENKTQQISPYFNNDTYFCSTRSLSVKGFCAAVIHLPENKRYCISAWRDFSEDSLTALCILSEYMDIPNR